MLRDTLRRARQLNLTPWSPAGVSRAYASLLLMCSEKAQNSYSALPALDAPVGFIQDLEDVISFDFSESLKSCIAPRNLEITLSETNKVVINNYKSGSADILPRFSPFKSVRYEEQKITTLEAITIGNGLRVETSSQLPIVIKHASLNCPDHDYKEGRYTNLVCSGLGFGVNCLLINR